MARDPSTYRGARASGSLGRGARRRAEAAAVPSGPTAPPGPTVTPVRDAPATTETAPALPLAGINLAGLAILAARRGRFFH